MVCFGILWWCVGILPFLNLYRMQQEIGERYSYLPNVGLMIILASFISQYPYVVSAFLAMYATKTWFYIDAYRDDFWLIECARFNSPDSWFAWHIAAMKRWEKQSYTEAIIYWIIARSISPKEFKILFNLASALLKCNNLKESMELLNEAEINIPKGQEAQAGALVSDFRLLVKENQDNVPMDQRKGKIAILV
jgi:tetratricopeptide (TPR) repeat protein